MLPWLGRCSGFKSPPVHFSKFFRITMNDKTLAFIMAAAYAGFRMGSGITAGIASAFSYIIKPGWDGLRDTPLDLERQLIR